MTPIRPPLGAPHAGGAAGGAASSAASAARAVVDGFVALLAMAVEPRGSSGSGSSGGSGASGSDREQDPVRDAVPERSPAPNFGYADAAAPLRAPVGSGASDEGGAEWTPLPAPRSVGWTPMPAPGAEGPWTPTLRPPEPAPPPPTHVGPPADPAPELAARPREVPRDEPPPAARTPDLGVPSAPSAPVPHGRSRARSTFPPQSLRSTPIPAQRAGWMPGMPEAADRLAPKPPLGRSPRGGTAEPPDPPLRPGGPPGTVLDTALGLTATPITPERRAARYAAVAIGDDAVGADARAVSSPSLGGEVPLDPARFVTPFAAYERQQGPRMARTLGAAPPTDPVAALWGDVGGSDDSTAVPVSPGSPVGRRETGADPGGPEPDLPHGSPVAAVPLSDAEPGLIPGVTPAAVTPGAVPASALSTTAGPTTPDLVEIDPDALPMPALPKATELDADGVERVRVQLARDLAMEVAQRDGRVDVTVIGSTDAVQPLRDLGPELDAGLLAGGFQLGQFEAQAREGSGQGEDGGEAEPKQREPERPMPPVSRSRFGRYA